MASSGTTSSTDPALPTLNCDPNGYLIRDGTLYRVNITTGAATLIRSGVGGGGTVNAMGYNVGDNYLYAAYGGSAPTLLRIAGTGDAVSLGPLNATTALNTGDVDENAQYWASAGGAQWLQIDLRPGSPTFGRAVANGTASPAGAVLDWAYVPRAGGDYLYGLAWNTLQGTVLMQFSRATKTWAALTSYGQIVSSLLSGQRSWGAVYASDDGFLYGSENSSGEIWRFQLPANGTAAVKVADGIKASANDGARCIRARNL